MEPNELQQTLLAMQSQLSDSVRMVITLSAEVRKAQERNQALLFGALGELQAMRAAVSAVFMASTEKPAVLAAFRRTHLQLQAAVAELDPATQSAFDEVSTAFSALLQTRPPET